MPELGETWCVVNSQPFVEAVVTATGPSMIRLVDRYGRRISASTSNWHHVWRLTSPAPTVTSACHECGGTAYFRFVAWDSSLVWSCEDHLPYGAPARFPGDSTHGLLPKQDHACPECQGTNVRVLPIRIQLPKRRSTIQCVCDDCRVQWSPLLSLGLADDGARLVQDLHEMVENQGMLRASLGFTAYRNLCRALNMGDVDHVRGVPIRWDPAVGDQLTFAFSSEAPEPHMSPAETFQIPFKLREILAQSEWKRRTVDGRAALVCTVVSAGEEVLFSVLGKTRTQSRRDFLQYWQPGNQLARPIEASLWRHRETDQFIQVLPATATHAAHQQVHYVNSDGQRETTALRSFQRLYLEQPTPPEDQIWHWQDALYEVERVGSHCHLRPHWPLQAAPAVMDAQTLYSTCRPLVFSELVTIHQASPSDVVLVTLRDGSAWLDVQTIRSGSRWLNKSSPEETITVKDIGILDSSRPPRYVRFEAKGSSLTILEAEEFCQRYELLPEPPPCQVGETWVTLGEPRRQCTIRKADNLPLRQATVEWKDGFTEIVSHERLVSECEKLDTRSYWEMLDSEDGD